MPYRWGTNPLGNYQKVILPWHRPETLDQHEENIRTLERIDWGSGQGTRWRTIVIAASNSTALSKSTADYVCTGSSDQVTINTAINSLEALGPTAELGRIVLLEGLYNLSATIYINTLTARQIAVEGMGSSVIGGVAGTIVTTGTGAFPCFTLGGSSVVAGSAVILENMHLASNHAEGTISSFDMPTVVRFCSIVNTGGGWGIAQNNGTGTSGGTRIEHNRIVSNGTGMQISVGGGLDYPSLIANNLIAITGGGYGIFLSGVTSTVPTYLVTNNYIHGGGIAAGGVGVGQQNNSSEADIIADNTIVAFTTGINAGGYRHNISGNVVQGCATGIQSGADSQYLAIIGNHVTQATVAGITVGTTFIAITPSIIANKVSDSTGTGITVGALATNAGVYLNDVYGGYSTGTGITDTGTGTRQALTLPTGGATDTVLKKASAADGDVAWAVDPALDLLTAKGSFVVASATDVGADFPIGRDNALLYPDSSQTLGVKWGRTLYVQTTDPSLTYTPALGDVWIDTT